MSAIRCADSRASIGTASASAPSPRLDPVTGTASGPLDEAVVLAGPARQLGPLPGANGGERRVALLQGTDPLALAEIRVGAFPDHVGGGGRIDPRFPGHRHPDLSRWHPQFRQTPGRLDPRVEHALAQTGLRHVALMDQDHSSPPSCRVAATARGRANAPRASRLRGTSRPLGGSDPDPSESCPRQGRETHRARPNARRLEVQPPMPRVPYDLESRRPYLAQAFTDAEYDRRVTTLRNAMEREGLDALCVFASAA